MSNTSTGKIARLNHGCKIMARRKARYNPGLYQDASELAEIRCITNVLPTDIRGPPDKIQLLEKRNRQIHHIGDYQCLRSAFPKCASSFSLVAAKHNYCVSALFGRLMSSCNFSMTYHYRTSGGLSVGVGWLVQPIDVTLQNGVLLVSLSYSNCQVRRSGILSFL